MMQPKLSPASLCNPLHHPYAYTHFRDTHTKTFSLGTAWCRHSHEVLPQISFTAWLIDTDTEQWPPSERSINLDCSTLHRSWSSGPFGVDRAHGARGLVPREFRCLHSTCTFTFYSFLQRQGLKTPLRSLNSPPCQHEVVALQFISQ